MLLCFLEMKEDEITEKMKKMKENMRLEMKENMAARRRWRWRKPAE